jgi:tRNA modification GTPase
MGDRDTIVALSSGKGRSALAVIRLSGPAAFSIVEACVVPRLLFCKQAPQTLHLFNFVNPQTKKEIDQVTAVKYVKPCSYTGEDMVELFCHGSEIVVEKILSVLMDCGAEGAERGDFTRRAFLNGKIDLVKAEAINQLIESRSDRALESSVEAYFGGHRKSLLKWKQSIKAVLAGIEAKIEFPEDDDVLEKKKDKDWKKIDEIIKEIKKDIIKKEKSRIIEKGINVPIVGIPNAGKSSLFNLLLECDRSIVHWEEGTTRDSISEEVLFGTEKVRLLDTAGLRDTKNKVEMIGIGKTEETIRKSALVVWVTPADRKMTRHEETMVAGGAKNRVICIISKADLGNAKEKKAFLKKEHIPFISVCLLKTSQREILVSFISDQILKKTGILEMPNVIHNKRQEKIARRLIQNLEDAEKSLKNGEEICARYLQKALEDIGQYAGETTSDEILNSIFSEFCIGK